MIASATGSSYSEVVVRRAAGFVWCHDPARASQETEVVAQTLDRVVVLDITAAFTLALLDPDTRSLLVGSFGQLQTTDAAYRDTSRGQETLGLRSTMSTGWDPEAGKPNVSTIDQASADLIADQASRLSAILRNVTRRSWQGSDKLADASEAMEWLSALDMAAADGLSFWCDDVVLRAVADNMGVRTFDTVALLRYLQAQGRFSKDALRVAEATLVSNYYADLGFDPIVSELAAEMDSWQPRGAAFVLTRPASWTDPAKVMQLVFEAIARRADEGLDDIEGWVGAAAIGLARIAVDARSAGLNLRILLSQCMAQSWIRALAFSRGGGLSWDFAGASGLCGGSGSG
jgi:TPR-GreAB-C-PIN type conflict system protein